MFDLKGEFGLTDLVSITLGDRLSEGDLNQYAIGDLLQLAQLQKRTALLDITNNEHAVSIHFSNGKIDDLHWKTRPDSKKLANTLVSKKLLTKEEAVLALEHQRKSVQRLGAILLSMELVTRKNLTKILAVHTIEATRIAAGMQHGTFTYRTTPNNGNGLPGPQKIDFEKLGNFKSVAL